jgi:sodium transport system ATP-binding protein
MIEAQGISKLFDGRRRAAVRAVDEVSFRCEAGEVFGLLGMNGAGKTTTLRMLATVLRPTAGTATICGHDVVRDGDRVRRQIGYLSGDTRLYDRLQVREVLEYFCRLQGADQATARRRSGELVERFALESLATRRVGKLSTGQKQRVNLARAMIHDPPVLILDEPSSGLDVMGAREVGRMVREARDEGRCVLLSTHIMREAERLCDRLAIIHAGRILLEGTAAGLTAGGGDLEDVFASTVEAAGHRPDDNGS